MDWESGSGLGIEIGDLDWGSGWELGIKIGGLHFKTWVENLDLGLKCRL